MSGTLFDHEEPKMPIGTLAQWFGSNRMLAPVVGKMLGTLDWCGVVFAGGMSEVPYIQAREVLVNDIHLDIINLARVVAGGDRQWLAEQADAKGFHPVELYDAQQYCKAATPRDRERALQYFVATWMGRATAAGTDKEFDGNLAVRFTASGGGSNVRYRSAIESLAAWEQVFKRCEFSTLDFRVFLEKCHDRKFHAIYSDSPFPDTDKYKHRFAERDHRDLATMLGRFKITRVVARFYNHPLIRELYPEPQWKWHDIAGGRTQANKTAPEVLLVNQED